MWLDFIKVTCIISSHGSVSLSTSMTLYWHYLINYESIDPIEISKSIVKRCPYFTPSRRSIILNGTIDSVIRYRYQFLISAGGLYNLWGINSSHIPTGSLMAVCKVLSQCDGHNYIMQTWKMNFYLSIFFE